ncbi:MAG: type II secretion system protein [Candidatus Nomurabacteria bacterium]|nr:type II secretion system protein [Candidatus Nomurabacteria bacterium]
MKDFLKIYKFIRKNTNLKSIKAFTLVETLVSIFIVTIVILGPLTVAMNASSYAKQTKDVMTATYLAQEATELLHHLQESIYLKCVSDTSINSVCQSTDGDLDGLFDIPSETSWRVFKEYLATSPSCFAAAGCSYDFIDMTSNENIAPTKYVSTSSACSSLYLTATNLYVCAGIRGVAGGPTFFTRKVQIESIPTFAGRDASYNDDLRVISTVTFRRSNGYTRSIKLIDFLHIHK